MKKTLPHYLGLSLAAAALTVTAVGLAFRSRKKSPIVRLDDVVAESDLKIFREGVSQGKTVAGILIQGHLGATKLVELSEIAQAAGAKSLGYIRVTEEGWLSAVSKFLSETEIKQISGRLNPQPGDSIFFVIETKAVAQRALTAVAAAL